MPESIVDLLNKGAQACIAGKFRRGNLISLPAEGSVIVTGDIHGHRRNFERIMTFADLSNNPARHVILQEIIHGGPQDSEGGCLSYKLLFDVVRYKLNYPDRVHIIMGNHDTAVINDSKVMKNGKEMNKPMNLAMDREFQQASAEIKLAMRQFLLSQPLAVRCDNRIWLSHSLPGNHYLNKFDKNVLQKQLEIADCVKPGSAYLLTWGRNHTQQTLDTMAKLLDVDTFILGHQPQEQGWSQAGENLIIIASNHNHGCLLPINLAQSYSVEQLIDSIVPLTSIA
jgi:predicted phosphodiesterase